jgi:2-keto-4-pentenoate hydratase
VEKKLALELAAELIDAARTLHPVPPLSERYPELDADDAYQIQQAQLSIHTFSGRRLVGHKIGLTSTAMRQQLGIDSPDYGYLLQDMLWQGDSPVAIPLDGFIQPRAEPEIAFIIGEDVTEKSPTRKQLAASIRAVAPAIEVIDSRIEGWQIKLVDTIADNASSAAVIIGQHIPWAEAPTLSEVDCALYRDHQLVAEGTGSAVMGDPLNALAWLARLLVAKGRRLRRDEVVIPGALTAAIPISTGATVRATFDGLGEVACSFR